MAAGNDPADWLIESQLAMWEQRNGWPLTPEQEADLRRLSGDAASRFELVERLQVYNLAETCIRTMQEMSFDRQDFQPARFHIATQPGGLLHPHVRAEWHSRAPGDHAASAGNSTIWIPVNALQMFAQVVWVIATRAIMQVGDLHSLIAALAQHLTWYDALEILREYRLPNVVTPSGDQSRVVFPPPPDQPPRSQGDPIREGAIVMNNATAVFVAGHEAGHLYLGHFGDRKLTEVIRGGRDISPPLRREMDADSVGINAVWDGLAANGQSIDITWTGPVVALATSAGIAAAHPHTDRGTPNDTWEDWARRLAMAVRVLGEWLIGNRLGFSRSAPILVAASHLATCIYEYVRTGGELVDGSVRLGAPGAEVFAMLKDTALPLLERFGQLGDNPS